MNLKLSFFYLSRILYSQMINLSDHGANHIRNVLSLENYALFENHGCWCSKFSGQTGGGAPAEQNLDLHCKTYHSSTSCIFLPGGACANYGAFSNLHAQGITGYDMQCSNNENDCLKAICEVDKLLAQQAEHFFDSPYVPVQSDCDVDTGAAFRAAVDRHSSPKQGGDLEKICVGTPPYVQIENSVVFDYGQDAGFDSEYDTSEQFNLEMMQRARFGGWDYEIYDDYDYQDYEHQDYQQGEFMSVSEPENQDQELETSVSSHELDIPVPQIEPEHQNVLIETVIPSQEKTVGQSATSSVPETVLIPLPKPENKTVSEEKLDFLQQIEAAKTNHLSLSEKQDQILNSMGQHLAEANPDLSQLSELDWQFRMQQHLVELENMKKECEVRDELIKQQKEQLEYLHGIMETLTKTLCEMK